MLLSTAQLLSSWQVGKDSAEFALRTLGALAESGWLWA